MTTSGFEISGLDAAGSPQAVPAPAEAPARPAAPRLARRWSWRRPFDYVVAALAVALATLANIGMSDLIAFQVSPLYFAAVMVAAWFGGLGPGLFATAFASFLSVLFFTEPVGFLTVDLADLIRLGVFVAVALLISWLTSARDKANMALRRAHAGLELRVAERTGELRQSNAALNQEINIRREAERELLRHQEQLRELPPLLARAEERERRRIARLLHDDVGQMLSLTQMRLEQARQILQNSYKLQADHPRPAERDLDQAQALLEQAIARTRGLTCELSPPILYELGLEAAIEWLVEGTRHRCDVELLLSREGEPVTVDEERSVVLFQVVRELLNNLVKHARPKRAQITIRWMQGEVQVEVSDDGVGFDTAPYRTDRYFGPDRHMGKNSFGLFNARERLRHEGGRLEITSKPGAGSTFVAAIPLGAPAEHLRALSI